jgi:hypothetical protein
LPGVQVIRVRVTRAISGLTPGLIPLLRNHIAKVVSHQSGAAKMILQQITQHPIHPHGNTIHTRHVVIGYIRSLDFLVSIYIFGGYYSNVKGQILLSHESTTRYAT